MQIGTPGSAYGPGQVMSRPTLGRAIRPLPRGGDVIGAALRSARVPTPTPFNPAVLHGELQRRLLQARQMQAAQQYGGAAVMPGVQPDSDAAMFTPGAMTPTIPAFTAHPQALLARARLAALLRGT